MYEVQIRKNYRGITTERLISMSADTGIPQGIKSLDAFEHKVLHSIN